MRHLTRNDPGARGDAWRQAMAGRRRDRAAEGDSDRLPMRPHRSDATRRHGVLSGVQDYVNLINSKGGVDGYKVRINEIDNNYQVPPAIEEYERHKQEGAVST